MVVVQSMLLTCLEVITDPLFSDIHCSAPVDSSVVFCIVFVANPAFDALSNIALVLMRFLLTFLADISPFLQDSLLTDLDRAGDPE